MKKLAKFTALVLLIAALSGICPFSASAGYDSYMEDIVVGYNMVFYCTKRDSYPNSLMFRNYSIEDSLFQYGADSIYGEKYRTRYVDAGEFAHSIEFPADGKYISVTYDDQTRAGYQMGNTAAYNFGDDNYFWFVESVVTASERPSYGSHYEPQTYRQEQIAGYNMVHYGTQTAEYPYYRMFRDYSILHDLEAYGARDSYGEKHLTKYVTVEQMSRAKAYPANRQIVSVKYDDEIRAGYQMGSTTAYNFGDDNYIWYIESVVMK